MQTQLTTEFTDLDIASNYCKYQKDQYAESVSKRKALAEEAYKELARKHPFNYAPKRDNGEYWNVGIIYGYMKTSSWGKAIDLGIPLAVILRTAIMQGMFSSDYTGGYMSQ